MALERTPTEVHFDQATQRLIVKLECGHEVPGPLTEKMFCDQCFDPDGSVGTVAVQGKGLPKLIQPSRTSCLPTAFAMVIYKGSPEPGEDLKGLLAYLGRDDERGFHVQELTSYALAEWKIAFVPFEAKPDMERVACRECHGGRWLDMHHEQGEYQVPCDRCDASGEEPMPLLVLKQHPFDLDAVAVGTHQGKAHAVAWCAERQLYLDPQGGTLQRGEFMADAHWVAVR